MSSAISVLPSTFSTLPVLGNLSTAAPIATPVVIAPPLNATSSWSSVVPIPTVVVYDPECGCHRTVPVPTRWVAPNTTVAVHPTAWTAPKVTSSLCPSASASSNSTLAMANAGNVLRIGMGAGWVMGVLAMRVGILQAC